MKQGRMAYAMAIGLMLFVCAPGTLISLLPVSNDTQTGLFVLWMFISYRPAMRLMGRHDIKIKQHASF
jgi:hypothetical protein